MATQLNENCGDNIQLGGANSRRMQRDFYEWVVQIPGEGNVISTNDGGNSKRMQRDFYEWWGKF